ncbi:hypothetical protein ACTWP6_16365 [Mycobacterium sp. 4D054]|uniref:hypothetical protein n=1 Tax=Mycobacterium sp. 4D054 TaxID=3457440 RepID=UPI003FD3E0FA
MAQCRELLSTIRERGYAVDLGGAEIQLDTIAFARDYPRAEGTWPITIASLAALADKIGPAV